MYKFVERISGYKDLYEYGGS